MYVSIDQIDAILRGGVSLYLKRSGLVRFVVRMPCGDGMFSMTSANQGLDSSDRYGLLVCHAS